MWNKMRHYLLQRWQTLTFKILLYFSLTVLIVAIILGVSFTNRIKPNFKSELLPNLARYVKYVVEDIGFPSIWLRLNPLPLNCHLSCGLKVIISNGFRVLKSRKLVNTGLNEHQNRIKIIQWVVIETTTICFRKRKSIAIYSRQWFWWSAKSSTLVTFFGFGWHSNWTLLFNTPSFYPD
jgi:hypothetical protein